MPTVCSLLPYLCSLQWTTHSKEGCRRLLLEEKGITTIQKIGEQPSESQKTRTKRSGNSISCGRNTHPPRIFQGKVIGYAADDFPREVAKTDIDVQAAKHW